MKKLQACLAVNKLGLLLYKENYFQETNFLF
jgi:hypothetical protein